MAEIKNLHLVFSSPPPQISDEEYNKWYDFHLTEILRTPGYEAARRYELTTHVGTRQPAGKRFVSVYEMGPDIAQQLKDLDDERPNMDLADWFSGISFASFVAETRPGYGAPATPDHLYLVFSSSPEGVTDHDYDDFYARHLAENIAVAGFGRAWRFRVTPTSTHLDPDLDPMSHVALYELHDSMAAIRPGLDAAKESGAITFPSWFPEIDFSSVEGRALGERVVSL